MIWVLGLLGFGIIVTFVTTYTGYRHLNSLWVLGPIYWIIRDSDSHGKLPILLSTGFMRQTSYPWRTGCGVQICIMKYTYQFGVCLKSKKSDDTDGLLHAVKGRILETPVQEIGEW